MHFSRVCNPGRTREGDEERFWCLVCVIFPEMSLINVLGCCHGSYSQFRTWGYGSFWALKADGSSLTIRKEEEGWDEALQQRGENETGPWVAKALIPHGREVQRVKGQSFQQVLQHMWNPSGSLFPWCSVVWAITRHPTGRERHPVGRGKSYLCF